MHAHDGKPPRSDQRGQETGRKIISEGMKTTWVWLIGWYGEALYRIGFTWQCSDGLVGNPPGSVPPALPGSLEERIPKYRVETVARPGKAFDAIYFIATMKAANLIRTA
jgi:hypothetical protein